MVLGFYIGHVLYRMINTPSVEVYDNGKSLRREGYKILKNRGYDRVIELQDDRSKGCRFKHDTDYRIHNKVGKFKVIGDLGDTANTTTIVYVCTSPTVAEFMRDYILHIE
jgi:hypothetical protein